MIKYGEKKLMFTVKLVSHRAADGPRRFRLNYYLANDTVEINELTVKANTLYHYKLESKDVIHDFSVPVWRLKQDAIPGRIITGWFEPTLTSDQSPTGYWDIQCAEICGVGHALMGGKVFVKNEADYAAWVAENSPVSLVSAAAPTGGGR